MLFEADGLCTSLKFVLYLFSKISIPKCTHSVVLTRPVNTKKYQKYKPKGLSHKVIKSN